MNKDAYITGTILKKRFDFIEEIHLYFRLPISQLFQIFIKDGKKSIKCGKIDKSYSVRV